LVLTAACHDYYVCNNGKALLHDIINDVTDEEDGDYSQYDETQYDEAREG
jgi:hypothetical protein